MTRFLVIAASGQLLFSVGCQPRADIAGATRDLLRTDQAWASLAAGNGPVDSIVAYSTPDARVVLPGQPVVVDTDAIREMVTAMQAIPGFNIS